MRGCRKWRTMMPRSRSGGQRRRVVARWRAKTKFAAEGSTSNPSAPSPCAMSWRVLITAWRVRSKYSRSCSAAIAPAEASRSMG